MELILGLMFGVVLLYFWLTGHWFARVLVWLGLAYVPAFFAMFAILNPTDLKFLTLTLGGIVVAWFVSGIPRYYWQYWAYR